MLVSRFGFIISLISFLCLASVSTGFDLYAHGVIYYLFDYPNTHSYLLFEEIVVPRYMLLSYIYEITRRLGIPIGAVASIMVMYPTYKIAVNIVRQTNKEMLSVSQFVILFFVVVFALFYSGLSLVLLWLMALLLTKERFFMLGVLFHPVGFLLGTMLALIFRNYLKNYLIIVLVFFIFLYLFSMLEYFTASKLVNIRYVLTFNRDELLWLFEHSVESKFNEFMIMIIILVAYTARTKFKLITAPINKIKVSKNMVIVMCLMLLLFSNLYFLDKERNSLVLNIFSFNITTPIYYTWFDWGSRDLEKNKHFLNSRRYE